MRPYSANRSMLLVALLCVAATYIFMRVDREAEQGKPPAPRPRSATRVAVDPRPVVPTPGDLGADEKATIEVFKRVSPSVCYVTNTAVRRGYWSLDIFKVPQGTGSGFVWDKDGHLVTNYHVIHNADAIEVTFSGGEAYSAKVVGAAPDKDLAVLRIEAPPEALQPVMVGTSRDLQVGQKVLAIGNPFGLDHTLTTGVVSALGRTIDAMTGRAIQGVIQTDAAITPGNSGGPLLDSYGRLVGVNTAIASPTGASAGIGFAVPVDTVNRVVPVLIRDGKIARPGLGIVPIDDKIAARLGLEGVGIHQVGAGSAASRAGLEGIYQDRTGRVELGHVILSVDGEQTRALDDLLDILANHQVGDEVELTVRRGLSGQAAKVRVRLQALDD